MSLKILPLAITMMAGPQIMSAVIFVTSKEAVRLSLAFQLGVAVATTVGTAIATGLVSALGLDLGDSSTEARRGCTSRWGWSRCSCSLRSGTT